MDQTQLVTLELTCPDCEQTHEHEFYSPEPTGSHYTRCPRCNTFGEHDIVGRFR